MQNKCPPLNLWNYIIFWNWIIDFSQPIEEYRIKKAQKETIVAKKQQNEKDT